MVKYLPFLCIFLVIGCSEKNQEEQLFELKSITIDSKGSYSGYISSDETAESCKTFVLENDKALNFFKHSQVVTLREYEHDLTASNCYVNGTFVSSLGEKGTWKIDRARRGMLTIGADTTYYYCSDCKSSLFYK